MMRDCRRLTVWSQAQNLALVTYRITNRLPDEERFGLTSQMRRSAVSIASNVAEGHDRGSDRGFARFIHIASGSNRELDTHSYRLATSGRSVTEF